MHRNNGHDIVPLLLPGRAHRDIELQLPYSTYHFDHHSIQVQQI